MKRPLFMESKGDLVLLSWNHPELTRPCVESLCANTTVPARLIIIDQGSDEETRNYLKSLRSTPHLTIDLLWNPFNVGYPKGMNQGLSKSTAPFVCFLNNDVLVPPGWLEELIFVAESDPSIGLVNPASNTFGIYPTPGTDWRRLAEESGTRHGQWVEVRYGEGFCLLGKREVLLKVGGFDETIYEQIYFEDADLGRKIQAQGLRCVMARGTYVWHEGGQTMSARPERLRLFQENERRFIRKWGKGERLLYALTTSSADRLRELGEQARAEANRSGQVWILVDSHPASKELPQHLGIRTSRLPEWQIPWVALWKALTKKKKFDRIVTDVGWLRLILKPLRFLHHATID